MKNSYAPLPLAAAAFLALLGLFALGAVWFFFTATTIEQDKLTGWPPLLRGESAAAFEKHYEKNLPYRDAAIAGWGAVRYGLFNTGSDGVVIGNDGWLYTAEEFTLPSQYETHLQHNLSYISQVRATLQKKGIALLVVMVPAKARIYPEHLGSIARPPAWDMLYETARTTLSMQGGFLDAAEIWGEIRHSQQLFMARDTHWSPAGAQLVARGIAAYLDRECPALPESAGSYYTIWQEEKSHAGDLLDFVPTGAWRKLLGPDDEPLNVYATEQEDTATTDLFATPEIPVALIGTSYSAHEGWHFEGFLKEALRSDVLNLADAGGGPMEPMAKFLRETDFAAATLKLVIWEFPERFLPLDYSEVEWPTLDTVSPAKTRQPNPCRIAPEGENK